MDKIASGIFLALGALVGFLIHRFLVAATLVEIGTGINTVILVILISAGGLFGLSVFPIVFQGLRRLTSRLEANLQKVPTQDLVAGAFGAIIFLLIAVLLTLPLSQLPYIGIYLPIGFTLLMGYLGMQLAIKKREDLFNLFTSVPRSVERVVGGQRDRTRKHQSACMPKILDTSVIIDGRILDIFKTGFIDGMIIVPTFILEELQHIADSADPLKRNRGRRGLDVLGKMRKDAGTQIQILDCESGTNMDVDSRLLKLAQSTGGKIVTNDYNLNKVAQLRGVSVLNINELANALKPILLPGEEMMVYIVKDGKEAGQGVAYLDDGTMVVVDGGRRFIGEEVEVSVTSVLQTAAGRMIFAKPGGK
ncbi:MAG: TRAM domain-containing protein [Firmicutes bacterium]|jgi:uncharacterized protein YacL|nr:TRAM domain-containing protein [Bacillota bacterium]